MMLAVIRKWSAGHLFFRSIICHYNPRAH